MAEKANNLLIGGTADSAAVGILSPADDSLTIKGGKQGYMRWFPPDYRCEIWTGERWIDLERDLLQKLEKLT